MRAKHSIAFERREQLQPARVAREPLINLRIVAHCAFDSRATVWTGN
jgi:hypothetical protein